MAERYVPKEHSWGGGGMSGAAARTGKLKKNRIE